MKTSSRKVKSTQVAVAKAGKADPELFPIVGIGASAGGLEAFSELLHGLPEKTGMAFVLVQHLDPKHSSALQEILARTTTIPVSEVTQGTVVQPDHAYVIPANTNLTIKNGTLHLASRVMTRGQHMAIDNFFRSLAESVGQQAIGVILSGTAADGTEGCRAIKAAGGITFAQDPESAKYDSMPRNAVNSGCIDCILPPQQIARELAGLSQHPYVASVISQDARAVDGMLGSDLTVLFGLLRESCGVDFANYKHTTLQRRIRRRMAVHKFENLKEYLHYIVKKPLELDELYRDLLIHVTGFFREPEAFEALRKHVYPKLFDGRKPNDSIRVWVAGCSTGEEVYSIAITLLEYMWMHSRNISQAATAIQIFATDISDTALDRARTGLYQEASVSEISAERLKRFFVRLEGGFQVNKSIREMCVFARQNLIQDPPYSNLDLVSCRNLLIYLGPLLQRRVIPTLHYALKPGGFLMLGASESLGGFGEHFGLITKKDKIYQKRKTAVRLTSYFTKADYLPGAPVQAKLTPELPASFTLERELDHILVNRFIPASIVVNDQMEIVQFHGKTGSFLEPPAGQPSFSLIKMAREGLLVDLREALKIAKKTNSEVRKEGLQIKSEGGLRNVNIDVLPLREQSAQERLFVVVFEDVGDRPLNSAPANKDDKVVKLSRSRARDTGLMTREIEQLRTQLQGLIQEHETIVEAYKVAHEEVLSANEELQSTNEELETSKEELQSTNEELTTLNEEMQNRNAELGSANNDLLNLLGHVDIPVVMVTNDLRIRRFTPPAQKLLNLLPGDVGRRLGEIRPNLEVEDLEALAHDVIRQAISQERQVRTKAGEWQVLHVRPYRTWDNRIEGAVISLQDVDALKRSLDQTRQYADTVVESAKEPILVLDPRLQVRAANPAFYRVFAVSTQETEGHLFYELGDGQWSNPKLRRLLEEIIPQNSRVDDFEMTHNFPRIGEREMLLNARRVELQPGHPFILLGIEDVTEKRAQGVA